MKHIAQTLSVGTAEAQWAFADREAQRLAARVDQLEAALRAIASMAEHSPKVVEALGFQNVRAIRAVLA